MSGKEQEEKTLLLERRLDMHIDEYRLHLIDEERKETRRREVQESTDDKLDKLIDSIQGLVDSWRFIMSFQRFIKWVSSFAVVIAVLSWLSSKFPNF